jgi:hypothetical protein
MCSRDLRVLGVRSDGIFICCNDGTRVVSRKLGLVIVEVANRVQLPVL